MRPAPLPRARHARLFELIRQSNLAELCRERQMSRRPDAVDDDHSARRAAQSLTMLRHAHWGARNVDNARQEVARNPGNPRWPAFR